MSTSPFPPLREVIDEFGLNARKSLGQHFLLDLNITRKIARLSEINASDVVIEIGPGPGGLTRALLEPGAQVIAIERDTRCIEALGPLAAAYPGKLILLDEDALRTDEPVLLQQLDIAHPIKVTSNLPYNISTELLIKWLKASPRWWSGLTLMFQKEVAERILAPHGNKTYGRLSVITQAIANPRKGFDLPARAFTPPPKVDSTVLQILPKDNLDFEIASLERVTASAFSQRRKMLRASLKPLFGDETEPTLTKARLDPTLRAEQVSVDGFICLANLLAR